MGNAIFFVIAFSLVWAVTLGYVLVLLNRQRRLRQELNALKEELKEK